MLRLLEGTGLYYKNIIYIYLSCDAVVCQMLKQSACPLSIITLSSILSSWTCSRVGLARTIHTRIYGVNTVFMAVRLTNIRSYMVYIHGFGHPCLFSTKLSRVSPGWLLDAVVASRTLLLKWVPGSNRAVQFVLWSKGLKFAKVIESELLTEPRIEQPWV